MSLQGFWSYVHADDQAEGERISRLAKDVVDQFEMLTGEPLDLFLDKDAIKWGEDWRDKIDRSLASVAFFIPVMTPRYFMSPECRRELQFFAREATRLGIKELVLPLLYVDVPSIHVETSTDDLITLVRTFQWEDWRELRFTDTTTENYRRGVARLAERLVNTNRHLEDTVPTTVAPQAITSQETEDDSPGFIDQVAMTEEALPKLTNTLESISQDIGLVGQAMQEAAAEVKHGGAHTTSFAARLLIARKLAQKLSDPVEHIWSLSNDFLSQLHDIDQGFRAIIERATVESEQDPGSRKILCDFFDAIRTLSDAANQGLGSAQGMIDAIEPIERMSRDLRPVFRRLRQGLTRLVEGQEVNNEWVRLLDSSGIVCED